MTSGAPSTVLVVDDEADVADAYAAQLEQSFRVDVAYSGEEALDTLDSETDIVLLDRRMPGLSGDEVLDRIRTEGLDVRVSMVTAVDPGFDIIEMPFDDYVTKPVSKSDLIDTIERLLTCAEYEDLLQDYYRTISKYATLLANKSAAELENSGEFEELERKRDAIKRQLEDTVDKFEDRHFATVFREIHERGEVAHSLTEE